MSCDYCFLADQSAIMRDGVQFYRGNCEIMMKEEKTVA